MDASAIVTAIAVVTPSGEGAPVMAGEAAIEAGTVLIVGRTEEPRKNGAESSPLGWLPAVPPISMFPPNKPLLLASAGRKDGWGKGR